jgi:general secretion pathway protein A
MYLKFFNLKSEPFHITPDPEFLFLSSGHKEALGAIIYGIEKRKGFVCITGEVGTGKTTIIRSALEKISKDRVKSIYFFNVHISFSELLKTIFNETGIASTPDDMYGMIRQLHKMLIEEYRKNHIVVLIIDEAQNMPDETLEKLRMLSNLETRKDKLLQIILVGQPELEKKLRQHKLRQLNQRIAIKTRIAPLSYKDSLAYIHHRLAMVARDSVAVFKTGALKKIAGVSRGIPRVLNILCDNALIAGFGYQKKPVSLKITREVIRDYEGKTRRSPALWFFALISGIMITGFLMLKTNPDGFNYEKFINFTKNRQTNRSQAIITQKINTISSTDKADEIETLPVEDFTPATGLQPQSAQTAVFPSSPPPSLSPEKKSKPISGKFSENKTDKEIGNRYLTSKSEAGFCPQVTATHNETSLNIDQKRSVSQLSSHTSQGDIMNDTCKTHPFPLKIIVKKGEYLTRLCQEIYGYTNDALIEHVKAHNPQIENSDLILIGDKITFPEPVKTTP